MNSPYYFEIQGTDPAVLVDFYKTVFNWDITPIPDMPIPYWRVETEGIAGGILKRPVAAPGTHVGTNAYTTSMEVESFDATAKRILDHGGQIAMEKFAIPGRCWQGYFLDPDNNTFGIFEADENAK